MAAAEVESTENAREVFDRLFGVKWEYMITSMAGYKHEDEASFIGHGMEGWELVSIYRDNGRSLYAVFKRRKL